MQDWRAKLASYLQRLMTQRDVSTHGIARKARQYNFRLSPTTVWDVANGKNKDVGIQTIKAIARGIGIPERDLFREVVDLPPSSRVESKITPNITLVEELYATAAPLDRERIEIGLELLRDYLELRAAYTTAGLLEVAKDPGEQTRDAHKAS